MVLPQDSTLRSIEATEEYVRAVLANVAFCTRDFGEETVVTLRLNGDERCPDYRVGAMMDTDTGQTMDLESYSGKTHKPLRPDQQMHALWSWEQMTQREVRDLLGEIRGFQTGKKPLRQTKLAIEFVATQLCWHAIYSQHVWAENQNPRRVHCATTTGDQP